MRSPAPARGPTLISSTLTDHRGATSPKVTLIVALLPCANGKVFHEKRCQQQVGRVGPGLVSSRLGPHHPPGSDRPHVVSRHLPRLLAANLHDLVQSMRFQSRNPKAPLNGNTDRLCTSTIVWAQRKVSGCRTHLPKMWYRACTYPRSLAATPPRRSKSCIPPDASKSPENDPPREPIAVVLGQMGY